MKSSRCEGYVPADDRAFIKHGALGVAPTSAVANILSLEFTKFTLGAWVTVWNVLPAMRCALILK